MGKYMTKQFEGVNIFFRILVLGLLTMSVIGFVNAFYQLYNYIVVATPIL